jgi:hypothetical protein
LATQIQIKRGSTTPAGLTVGENAMNTSTNQIYLGGTGGTVLVGGEVTGGVDMGAGSAVSANRIPTQSGVYNYVRNSTVTSFNGATGAVLADAVTWSVITADTTAVVNRGYFTNKATRLTLTLPNSPQTVGSAIRVSGMTAGGWKIQPVGFDAIHFGNISITSSNSFQSTHARDSVELICCGFTAGANSWNVVSSVGNIEIV